MIQEIKDQSQQNCWEKNYTIIMIIRFYMKNVT